MFSSKEYWETRYKSGGNSGVGSYTKFAEFKASFVNLLIKKYNIESIIEFGVGDGNQLSKLEVNKYVGLDVSETAIASCTDLFENDSSKKFYMANRAMSLEKADMSLSMDVIYHLVEDEIFSAYMNDLFNASKNFICIYSSNTNSQLGETNTKHVRHRRFSDWIERNRPLSRLVYFKKNVFPYNGDYKTTSFSDFYLYSVK